MDQFNRRRRLQYAAASLSVESGRKSRNYQRSNLSDEPMVLSTKTRGGERDAIRAAVDAAHVAGLEGLNGQVLLQDQMSIEWTYGKDPYPPRSSDYL